MAHPIQNGQQNANKPRLVNRSLAFSLAGFSVVFMAKEKGPAACGLEPHKKLTPSFMKKILT
jgi:hypothetical protein